MSPVPAVVLLLLTLASAEDKCFQNGMSYLGCWAPEESDLPTTPSPAINNFTFYHSKIPSIQSSLLSIFPNLEHFEPSYGQVETIDSDAFKGLALLSWVDVSRNKITDIDPNLFADNTKMERFIINGNEKLTVPIGKPLLTSTSLKTLEMNNCAISEVSSATFQDLPNLTQLWLNNNRLTNLPLDVFNNNRNLVLLNLRSNHFTTLPATIFASFKTLKANLDDNPWHCDCHLTPLILWANEESWDRHVACETPKYKLWDDIADPPKCES